MQDVNGTLKMPHDGYLKLFQLSEPDLSAKYDLIMVDEWQDTNPVTMDIVLAQDTRLILVGDKHQSIYGFRGATNAMDLVAKDADAVMSMTQSFRFGQGIADLATLILSGLKGEKLALIGAGKYESVFTVDRNQTYAFISRTNGALFREAVGLLGRVTFTLVGGGDKLENYPFDRLIDVHNLHYGQPVRDAFLRRFTDTAGLRDYAEKVDDKELLAQLAVVKEFGRRIPSLVEQIKAEACQKNPADAHVSLMTAHRAKGLQFMQVVLASDFEDFTAEDGRLRKTTTPELAQEANLLYVALTRTIHALETNAQIKAIEHKLAQMGFQPPVADPALLAEIGAAREAAAAAAPVERSETAAVFANAQAKAQPPVQLAGKLPTAPFDLNKRSSLDQIQHAICQAGLLHLDELAAYLGRTSTDMSTIRCVFQPIAATHFSGTRTAFQAKADTISG